MSGEAKVASPRKEVAAQAPFPVTLDDGFQNVAPAVGAVRVARAKGTPFKVDELVEHEQGMIARISKMTVVGRLPGRHGSG